MFSGTDLTPFLAVTLLVVAAGVMLIFTRGGNSTQRSTLLYQAMFPALGVTAVVAIFVWSLGWGAATALRLSVVIFPIVAAVAGLTVYFLGDPE